MRPQEGDVGLSAHAPSGEPGAIGASARLSNRSLWPHCQSGSTTLPKLQCRRRFQEEPLASMPSLICLLTIANVIVAEYSCAARNSHAVEQGSKVMTYMHMSKIQK